MSDFTNNFWSVYVAVAVVASIAACGLLLWLTARGQTPIGDDNTTGHVWDGDLREANNPMPRWWVGLFVLTILFGGGYLFAYPGLGAYAGKLGWSTGGEYQKDTRAAELALEPVYARFANMPNETLAADSAAMAIGERLFLNNCSQCHGSDARGSKGFPNLADTDWLHGGTPDKIIETITKGRIGEMPPMAAAVGTPDEVKNLAQYVLSLSGNSTDSLRVGLGRPKFAVCAACHGVGGVGQQAMGAPRLNDGIWLHGFGEDAIVAMINSGKHNVMPPQEGRLSPAQIKVLAAYVWGLSNKPAAAP